MFSEIIRTFRDLISPEVEWQKEINRFNRAFGFEINPNGVLTKPGEEIHPLHRGLITAGLSFSSRRKIIKGENLPEKERRQVREAAWLKSISGTYSLNLPPEGGVNVAITIDNNEALSYLTANADTNTMVAFLTYRDKRYYRYKESKRIGVIKENGTWLTYAFPQVQEDPTKHTSLCIYTRPLDDNKINAKFSRLNLLLWTAPKQTDSI